MTPRSLSQHTNLSQDSFIRKTKKRLLRKFQYRNELPGYANLYYKLKTSSKKNWRRWAYIIDQIQLFIIRGKGLCYSQTKTWVILLAKAGFDVCGKTFQNDLKALEDLGLIHRNSWTRPKNAKSGGVRHLITAWDLYRYEHNYIQAVNKKGKGKPKQAKKRFYAYKEKVTTDNFPQHNAFLRGESRKITREKIASPKISIPSFRTDSSSIYNPPIIPPQGGEIVKISQNQSKRTTCRVRKRRRTAKPRKIYQKVDDQRLIYALQRPERGTQITTATNPIGEMESALATMCHQPQFAGREDTLRTNFRIAWGLHRDRGTAWRKSPLHLAAHATLHGYAIKTHTTEENMKETKNTADIDYSILQPLLKWGIRTDPAPPDPLPAKAKYTAKSLAYALQKDHSATMEDLGYRAEAYGLRCITTCSDHTVQYDSPYVFAGLMEKCRDRGLVEIAKWFKGAFTPRPQNHQNHSCLQMDQGR